MILRSQEEKNDRRQQKSRLYDVVHGYHFLHLSYLYYILMIVFIQYREETNIFLDLQLTSSQFFFNPASLKLNHKMV